MVFNLKKYSTSVPTYDASPKVREGLEELTNTYEEKPTDIEKEDVVETGQTPEQKDILQKAQNLPIIDEVNKLLIDPRYKDIAQSIRSQPAIRSLLESNDLTSLRKSIDDLKLGPQVEQFRSVSDKQVQPEELRVYFDRIRTLVDNKAKADLVNRQREQLLRRQVGASKHAQIEPSNINEMPKAQFVQNYLASLMSYTGDKSQNDVASEQAKSKILSMVSPALQNDANDAVEEIQSLNTIDQERGKQILELVFDSFIAPATQETEQSVMSTQSQNQNDHIIKFDLKDHVEPSDGKHTKEAEDKAKMIKTARMHSNNAYFLYGPSEKRVCPKLRGKNVGDVVSEYICRHHCLDGIVIDDNKTVCGEAIWRANAMDKFSREYVDEDGKIVGGYLNKRFEINRNVPEETRMRLKPGEIRKPRPASMGNIESRMQDMRNKEGEKRGYKPDTNTGEPFVWDKDVDQNNVEATQAERDRREESMGHKTVQYTNKTEQENNPEVKTAQTDSDTNSKPENKQGKRVCPKCGVLNWPSLDDGKNTIYYTCAQCATTYTRFKLRAGSLATKKSFNLKQYKTAQIIPDDGWADGGMPYDDDEMNQISSDENKEKTDIQLYIEVVQKVQQGENEQNIAGWWVQSGQSDLQKLQKMLDQAKMALREIDEMGPEEFHNQTGYTNPANDMPMASSKFNLKTYKTAQCPVPLPEDGSPIEPVAPKRRRWNFNLKKHKEAATKEEINKTVQDAEERAKKLKEKGWQQGDFADALDGFFNTDKPEEYSDEQLRDKGRGKKSFTLKKHKEAQMTGPKPMPLTEASSKDIEDKTAKCKSKWTGGKNPYAICNKTSPKSEDPDKFNRCVEHVKEDSKDLESKNSKKKN